MILPNYAYVLLPIFFIYFILNALGNSAIHLVLSFILAYLSFPLIRKIENKKVPRQLATIVMFLVVFILILLGLSWALPKIYQGTLEFIKELPQNVRIVVQKLEVFLTSMGIELQIDKAQLIENVRNLSSKISMETFGKVTNFITNTFSGLGSFISGIINLFLFPIFFYYIIVHYEEISKQTKALVPRSMRGGLSSYFEKINEIFGGFFRGQFMVCFAQAVFYGVGLYLVGLKHGLLIGFVTGLLCFIPYVGFTLGAGVALIVGFANFQGWGGIIGIGAVFLIGQTVESVYLTPKFVGGSVGLNPLLSLLSLLIGGSVGGLLGIFLAIPVGAIVVLTIGLFVKSYKKSTFYLKK